MTTQTDKEIKEVFERWHQAVVSRDLDGIAALYADDANFESPAIWVVTGQQDGRLKGREAIKAYWGQFFAKVGKGVTEWYRSGLFFSNGQQLTWEYPRETPKGDQTDLVEWMDLENGLIANHRVYWGWIGVRNLVATMKESAK